MLRRASKGHVHLCMPACVRMQEFESQCMSTCTWTIARFTIAYIFPLKLVSLLPYKRWLRSTDFLQQAMRGKSSYFYFLYMEKQISVRAFMFQWVQAPRVIFSVSCNVVPVPVWSDWREIQRTGWSGDGGRAACYALLYPSQRMIELQSLVGHGNFSTSESVICRGKKQWLWLRSTFWWFH